MQNTAVTDAPQRVMTWLEKGLPIALVMDLFVGEGVDFAEVMRREGASRSGSASKWPHPAA